MPSVSCSFANVEASLILKTPVNGREETNFKSKFARVELGMCNNFSMSFNSLIHFSQTCPIHCLLPLLDAQGPLFRI